MKFFQTNINSAVPNVIVEEEISDDLDRRWGKESAFINQISLQKCIDCIQCVLIRDNSGTGIKKLMQKLGEFLKTLKKIYDVPCETF